MDASESLHSGGEAISWWGRHPLAPAGWRRWKIGPLSVSIGRTPHALCVAHESGTDAFDGTVVLAEAIEAPATTSTSIPVAPSVDAVVFVPRLADRSITTRPKEPLVIPARYETSVYVGSPLWLAIELEGGSSLMEMPCWRPSDTWFGSVGGDGELCYATRSRCRLDPDDLEPVPHRAYTRVRIDNRAGTPLVLERMKLPVRFLSLHRSPDARLWTDDVVLERSDDDPLAPLELRRQPPSTPERVENLTGPRAVAENVFVRVFASVFRR